MDPSTNNYAEDIAENFIILRPKNNYFPLKNGVIKRIDYYYSQLIEKLDVDSVFFKGVSVFARIFTGSWAYHSFVVISYEDES